MPPQFTDVDVVCNTNTNALCATTLNVTDSTVVMDNTIPGEYTNLNDYNFLRANRSIFPTFDNELVLTPTFTAPSGNFFGVAVATSGDGSMVAVGSTNFDSSLQRVDIYRRQGNTWIATQQLFPPIAGTLYFGSSLAMSYDGLVLAVGNPQNPFNVTGGGLVTPAALSYISMYVYDPVAKLYALNQTISGDAFTAFGTALQLSATGQYLITNEDVLIGIGATNPPIYTSISALIYVRSNTCNTACNNSATWALQARISARDNLGQLVNGATGNSINFAQHTTISADGETAILGWAHTDLGPGMVAIFKRQGTTWHQIQFITHGSSGAQFGTAVALSADGSYLAVTSGTGLSGGGVTIFKQSGSVYVQEQFFGPLGLSFLNRSVSLSADGTVLAMGYGATPFTGGSGNDGAVLIALRAPDGLWSRPFVRIAPLNSANELGSSIACSADGNFVVAGSPTTNSGQGAVSIFRPVGSFIPNDTVVTGSLCVYNRTTIDAALKVTGNIHVNGTVITGTAGHVTACAANLSDARIKDDIKPLDPQEALDTLRKLLPVTYEWRDTQSPPQKQIGFVASSYAEALAGSSALLRSDGSYEGQARRECGFVADDMEIVFPQFVWNRPSTDDEAQFVTDGKTKNILIRAELYAYIIAALERLVERNQKRNEELRELKLFPAT